MNAYEAKFDREAKAYPTCWIIAPDGLNRCKLIRIANDPKPRLKLGIVREDGSIFVRSALRLVK